MTCDINAISWAGAYGSARAAYVWLYPNDQTAMQQCKDGIVTTALENGLNQLLNNNSIDGYVIGYRDKIMNSPNGLSFPQKTEDPGDVDEETGREFAEEFVTWLNDKDCHVTNGHPDDAWEEGIHYGVSSEFDYGGGRFPNALDEYNLDFEGNSQTKKTSFSIPYPMILGTDGPDGRVRNFAIQEMCHGLVNAGLVRANDPTNSIMDYKDDGVLDLFHADHSLGKVVEKGQASTPNYVTPNATIHTGSIPTREDVASEGACSTTLNWGGSTETGKNAGYYTQELTNCAIEAVDISSTKDTQ